MSRKTKSQREEPEDEQTDDMERRGWVRCPNSWWLLRFLLELMLLLRNKSQVLKGTWESQFLQPKELRQQPQSGQVGCYESNTLKEVLHSPWESSLTTHHACEGDIFLAGWAGATIHPWNGMGPRPGTSSLSRTVLATPLPWATAGSKDAHGTWFWPMRLKERLQ